MLGGIRCEGESGESAGVRNNTPSEGGQSVTHAARATARPARRMVQPGKVRRRGLLGDARHAGVEEMRIRIAKREVGERALQHIRWLEPADRVLIQLLAAEGRSLRDLATLMGEPRRSLTRRASRLLARVLSEEFVAVARALDHMHRITRRVAIACVLQGKSLRAAAGELRLSLHNVRTRRASAREWVRRVV